MAFLSGLVSAAAGPLGMLAYAVPVSARLMLALLAMGLLAALGSICVFVALRNTTAAAVAHYHYTQLLSGAMVAYFFFREKPTIWMLAGAVLIINCSFLLAGGRR